MSSVKPKKKVVSLASMRPAFGSLATMVQPIASAALRARANSLAGGVRIWTVWMSV